MHEKKILSFDKLEKSSFNTVFVDLENRQSFFLGGIHIMIDLFLCFLQPVFLKQGS